MLQQLSLPADADICDFGCGDGVSFTMLEQFGKVRGIEVDRNLVTDTNRDRIFSEYLGTNSYSDWQCDLITALDVIEHIEDHHSALCELRQMLKPGGWLVLTVPAFMLLWDEHDLINHHYRRYTKNTLRQVLPKNTRLKECRYLFHAIFPIKLLITGINKLRRKPVPQHSIPSKLVNTAMKQICLWENRFLKWAKIPWGTSVLAVVQRIDEPAAQSLRPSSRS